MEIHVDYNPSPKDHFFISVHRNDNECISFDKTIKGHRMIKQIFREQRTFPENVVFDSEWETLVISGGTFVREYHVQWVDQGSCDWLNGELWETVWEKPISQELTDGLLHYSQLVSDHYKDLRKFFSEVKKFEQILSKELAKVPSK